jgi:hypothetical protein
MNEYILITVYKYFFYLITVLLNDSLESDHFKINHRQTCSQIIFDQILRKKEAAFKNMMHEQA